MSKNCIIEQLRDISYTSFDVQKDNLYTGREEGVAAYSWGDDDVEQDLLIPLYSRVE